MTLSFVGIGVAMLVSGFFEAAGDDAGEAPATLPASRSSR